MVGDLRNIFAGALSLGGIIVAVQLFMVAQGKDAPVSPWSLVLLGISGGVVLIGGLYSLLASMAHGMTLREHLQPTSPFAVFLTGFGLFLLVYFLVLPLGMVP